MIRALVGNSKALLQGHFSEFTKNTVKDASTALAVMKAVPFIEKEFGNMPFYKSAKQIPLPYVIIYTSNVQLSYILAAVGVAQQLLQNGVTEGVKEVGRRGFDFGAYFAAKQVLKQSAIPKQYEIPAKLALRFGSRTIGNWLGQFIFGTPVSNQDLLAILQSMSPKERKETIPVLNEALAVLPIQAKL